MQQSSEKIQAGGHLYRSTTASLANILKSVEPLAHR